MLNPTVIPPGARAMTPPGQPRPASKESNAPTGAHDVSRRVKLTYKTFEEHVRKLLAEDGWSRQRIANMASALHAWMRALEFKASDTVGEEFSTYFHEQFRRFEDLIAFGLAPRTQKDRQEQILVLKRLYSSLTIKDLLPSRFDEALAYALHQSGSTLADIARNSGIQQHVIGRWADGTYTPCYDSSFARIPALERALGLPADALLARLPQRRRARYERQKAGAEALDEVRASTRHADRMQVSMLKPTSRLQAQWRELIQFKTDSLRDGATARNSWRLKSVEQTGMRLTWAVLYDGAVCTTAGVHWCLFGPFLHFITTHQVAGRVVPPTCVDSLAWLTSAVHVRAYVQFLRARNGNVTHNGVITLLNNIKSHLRSDTGFIWHHPELVHDLCAAGHARAQAITTEPELEAAWHNYCQESYQELAKLQKVLLSQGPVRRARNPASRAEAILADEFPLKRLVKMTHDLEMDEPPQAHARDYAAWIRDVMLLKLLISNPLRSAQFSIMRCYGQRPNLYRTGDGSWRMRFNPEDFKNEKGAASGPYDTAVEPSAWPWIERYLSESRPTLINSDTEFLLLPGTVGPNRGAGHAALEVEDAGNWTGDGISKRVQYLTSRYLPDCAGFGGHCFRHIIATDHLKRHPQDYLTVAQLLHDSLATVIKAYSHLRVDDGLRTLHAGVAQALRELR